MARAAVGALVALAVIASATSVSAAGAPPGAPTTPTYTAIAQTSLTVNWTTGKNTTSCDVQRSLDGTTFTTIAPGILTQSSTAYTYADSGLTAGTTYWYRIIAYGNGSSTGNASSVTTLSTPPGAPGTPAFSSVAQTTLTVSWTAATGATSYDVQRSPDGTTYATVASGVATTTYGDTGLAASTTYWYRIVANNSGGSTTGSPNSVTTLPNPPGAPGTPTFTVIAQTTLTVSWTAATGATSYDVQRSPDGTTYATVATGLGATTFGDTGLTPGTTYWYRVVAYGAGGSTTGTAAPVTTTAAGTPPGAPGTPTYSAVTATSLTASWTASATGTAPITYTLQQGTSGTGPWTTVTGCSGLSTTTCNVTGLTGNGTSFFQVVANNAAGSTASGASSQLTFPDAPTMAAFGTVTQSSAVVNWAGPVGGAASYRVERSQTSGTSGFAEVAAGVVGTTWTDSGLLAGTRYWYRVRGTNATGDGAYSTALDTTTVAAPWVAEGSTVPGAPMVSIVNPLTRSTVSGTFRVQIRVYSPSAQGGIAGISGLAYSLDDGTTWSPTGLTSTTAYDTTTNGVLTGRTFEVQLSPAAGSYILRARVSNPVAANVVSNAVEITAAAAGTGDGRILVRDNSSQLCTDCHAIQGHTSEATQSTKGSWSTTCRDCHTPHSTRNIDLVAEQITPPAITAAQTAKTVTFYGKGGYAASSYASSSLTGPCQVCHTQTKYYRADGTDVDPTTGATVASGGHNPTGDCTSCHAHSKGLAASCTGCHGTEGRVSVAGADSAQPAAPPVVAPAATVFVANGGAHLAHVNQATWRSAPLACSNCHPWPNSHQGTTDVSWSALATTASPAAYTVAPAAGALTSTWTATPTCTNWCHGAGLAGGGGTNRSTPPAWTGTSAPCGSCHASPPPVSTATAEDHPQNTACASCHGGDYAQASVGATSKATHVNGTIDAPASGCTACHGVLAGLSGTPTDNTSFAAAPGFDPGLAGSLGVDTHGSSDRATVGVGAHYPHVRGSLLPPQSCDVCHGSKPANGDTTHANGTVAAGFGAVPSAGGVTPAPTAFTSSWAASPTCTNYCHSTGKPLGGTTTTTTVTWTSTTAMTCTSCHPTTALATNAHPKHVGAYSIACQACHAGTTSDGASIVSGGGLHVNASNDVQFTVTDPLWSSYVSGGSYDTAAHTCASTYCHSNGTATTSPFAAPVSTALAWTGTDACTSCHGGAAGAPVVMGVGAGNGSARHQNHVSNAAVIGTNYLCGDCHAATVAAGTNGPITNGANHVNRVKDVSIAARGSATSSEPYAGGTCSATYCHSSGQATPTYRTISWASGPALGCNGCHGTSTTAGAPDYANGGPGVATANSHFAHTSNGTDATSCDNCHAGTVLAAGGAIIAGSTLHTNGARDVQIATAYDTNGATSNYDPATKTCSAVSCHGSGTPQWGATLGCTACHGSSTRTSIGGADANQQAAPPLGLNGETLTTTRAVGAHVAHVNQATLRANPLPCAECHNGATHNGVKEVLWGTLATTNGQSPSWVYPNCSATYCHAPTNRKFGTTPATDATPGGTIRSPDWTAGSSQQACGTCHGAPPPVNATASADHPQNTNCAACHGTGYATAGLSGAAKTTHLDGTVQAPANGCTACHGVLAGPTGAAAANTDPSAAPGYVGTTTGVDTKGNSAGTVGVGAHDAHVRPAGSLNATAPLACSTCHPLPATNDWVHANGTVDVSWTAMASSTGITVSPTAFTSTWEASPTCTNYCHSNAAPVGGTRATAAPIWTSTTNLTCTSCHQVTADNPANPASTKLSHSHWIHVTAKASGGYYFNCSQCHNGVASAQSDYPTTAGSIVTPSRHVNGSHDVAFDATFNPGTTSYTQGTSATNPYTCSNTYCHSNGTSASSPPANTSLRWDTGSSTCTSCHGGYTGTLIATGKHTNHVNNAAVIGTNYYCGDCHQNTVSAGATPAINYTGGLHVNRVKDVGIGPRGAVTSSEPYTSQTCSATYCHSSGQATPAYQSISWATGPALGCNGCHGTSTTAGAPDYANGGAGTATANSHMAHTSNGADATSCDNCHAGTVPAAGGAIIAGSTLHTNGARDVQLATAYDTNGATSNYASATKTCSAVSCHGTSTPQWGGTVMCGDCHLGASDVNNWNTNDGTMSVVSSTEWTGYGHGSTTVNLAQGKTGIDTCRYCHDWSVPHNTATNPFRLLGVTGANGAITAGSFDATVNYGDGVCWNCHGTGSNGVDPDGSGGSAYLLKNGTKKIDSYHYGSKHSATLDGGQRCWDCHDPHGDGTNIKMIGSDVIQDNSDAYGLVVTNRVTGVTFTADATGTDFANTSATSLCRACHTTTNHYTKTTNDGHNSGTACTACHAHQQPTVNTAFTPKGGGPDCIGCHGGGQGSTRPITPDFGLQSHHVRTVATLTTTGTGTFSSTATGAAVGNNYDCVVCHMEGQIVTAASKDCATGTFPTTCTNPTYHANGKIDLRDVDVAAPATDGTGTAFTYDKKSISTTGAPGSWSSVGGATNWVAQNQILDSFCLNCHDSAGAAQISTFRLSSETSRTGTDPFWDGAGNIGNTYDQQSRGAVVNIKDMVVAGSTDLDKSTDAGGTARLAQNIPDPPNGIYSRHAINGKSLSVYKTSGGIPSAYWVSGWNDTSVMSCADCHTVDGANGTSGNAHGSGSEYLLKDASGGATEGNSYTTYVCARCHNSANYDGGTHTANTSNYADSTGLVGSAARLGGAHSATNASIFGMACMNCHGGAPGDVGTSQNPTTPETTTAPAAGFGRIHGTSSIFSTPGTAKTRQAYRFTNGGALRYYDPNGWTATTSTCYTLGTADGWSSCTQHSGGKAFTKPLTPPRALAY